MNITEIFDLARDQTHVNDTDYPNTRLLTYANIVKNNFHSAIATAINEDYHWDYFRTNSVVNQDEYTLPDKATDITGLKKIKGLGVSYNGETYDNGRIKYTKAKEVDLSSLQEEWNYYVENQSKDNPIYYIADNSFFIAPAPDLVIENGILLWGIREIPDYTVTTTEPFIGFPIEQHDIIVQGILPYILKAEGKTQESITEKQEYIRQRDQAISELADRNLSPAYLDYPIERERRSDSLYGLTPYYNGGY